MSSVSQVVAQDDEGRHHIQVVRMVLGFAVGKELVPATAVKLDQGHLKRLAVARTPPVERDPLSREHGWARSIETGHVINLGE